MEQNISNLNKYFEILIILIGNFLPIGSAGREGAEAPLSPLIPTGPGSPFSPAPDPLKFIETIKIDYKHLYANFIKILCLISVIHCAATFSLESAH